MKAIMVMFDSLNRRMLPPYGCDWVHAPNFKRLAERSVRFDNAYVGSMPCMPARRELHTGRYNFLHRSWGPIEPFDVSMPEMLKENGICSHLVSDHYHYWEDGGATYHTRYASWEICRGQEGDPWKGEVREPQVPETLNLRPGVRPGEWGGKRFTRGDRQDWINRRHMRREENSSQSRTFRLGLDFIEANHTEDGWFLQIETFDPHEPFFCAPHYRDLYPRDTNLLHWDWPPYGPVDEGTSREQVAQMRYQYAALLSKCDRHLGEVLDAMDRYDLWKDTMLIVNTDHGYLLGEHGWWAKSVMPWYNEIAHIPLFIWDPRSGKRGEARRSLVQTIDLPASILECFGIDRPAEMQGVPLTSTIARDDPIREAALFGMHGGHVNCTDGRHVYMRAPARPENEPLFEYTLMPTRHGRNRAFIEPERLAQATMAPPFSFTRDCPLLKVPGRRNARAHGFGTLLFDLENDPGQEKPLRDAALEAEMIAKMTALMRKNECPDEQFERLGLDPHPRG